MSDIAVTMIINSGNRRDDGHLIPLRVTLKGRMLELRTGLLSAVKVNVDELREAIDKLEAFAYRTMEPDDAKPKPSLGVAVTEAAEAGDRVDVDLAGSGNEEVEAARNG